MAAQTLFQAIGASLDSATATLVTGMVQRLIETIYPWALTGLTLYIVAWGLLVMNSMIERPTKAGLIKAGKIILITSLALNAGNYMNGIVGALSDFSTRLTEAVTGQPGQTIYQSLDATLDSGLNLFGQCITKALDAGWTEMGSMISWFLTGLLFIITFLVVTVIGGAAIIIASALLKLAFGVGPFFLLMLAWPVTAHLFEKWMGKVVTYTFQIVMVAALMAIVVRVFEQVIGAIDLSAASDQNGLQVSLGVAATGALLYFLIHETAKFAGELGGGLAVEMMSATGMAQAALSPARTARRMLNPTSTRLDPGSGRQVTSSRAGHWVAGRTVANPVYRRGIQRMITNNWRSPASSGGTIKPIASPPKPSGTVKKG